MGDGESGAFLLIHLVILLAVGLLIADSAADTDWSLDRRVRQYIQCDGGIYAEAEDGEELLCWNADQPFVPASVLKLGTAAFVLSQLGSDYRPATVFVYHAEDHRLCVRGTGDPFLTSDELRIVADSLRSMGVDSIGALMADCSAFSQDLRIDGSCGSANPYDAGIGALAVNFNTMVFRIRADGTVSRGEPETPLTAMARSRARTVKEPGVYRISIVDGRIDGPRHALELMAAIFREKGIRVREAFSVGACISTDECTTYVHRNSKSLSEMVEAMLEYSNNLVANMLMLHATRASLHRPSSVADGAFLLSTFLRDSLDLQSPIIAEGSGLSRENRISPRDVVHILRYIRQRGWDLLLPDYQGVLAKSGTLTDVSCLAGFMETSHGRRIGFSILLQGEIDRRDRALSLLRRVLDFD